MRQVPRQDARSCLKPCNSGGCSCPSGAACNHSRHDHRSVPYPGCLRPAVARLRCKGRRPHVAHTLKQPALTTLRAASCKALALVCGTRHAAAQHGCIYCYSTACCYTHVPIWGAESTARGLLSLCTGLLGGAVRRVLAAQGSRCVVTRATHMV
jgi:hypothetical protein